MKVKATPYQHQVAGASSFSLTNGSAVPLLTMVHHSSLWSPLLLHLLQEEENSLAEKPQYRRVPLEQEALHNTPLQTENPIMHRHSYYI